MRIEFKTAVLRRILPRTLVAVLLMFTLYKVVFFRLVILVLFLIGGRPRSMTESVGRIDLSQKGAICDGNFNMNLDQYPGLVFLLSDTNGPATTPGTSPDWPLIIQADFFDRNNGRKVFSSRLTAKELEYYRWHSPATCLGVRWTNEWTQGVHLGHPYKLKLTVLEGVKGLGTAEVLRCWVENVPD